MGRLRCYDRCHNIVIVYVEKKTVSFGVQCSYSAAMCVCTEDVLREDKGECVICLEDLQQGHTIARLPCLCVYHKRYV